LTPQQLLQELQNLNTLLSIRMNIHEYDKIPFHFRDYSIKSGRVTFRIPGEFEVDLTIADEDPETQFWFIDFRFLFSPAIGDIPDYLRNRIESRVNAALAQDGLQGCYQFLHEMVLTHKISEFRKQAEVLGSRKWLGALRVEPLHRGVSIQYWVDRYGKEGPKSWILLGVHSGKRKDGRPDPKATSRISLRWFRDSKEVKDVEIPFDVDEISTEALLKSVIARHIGHYLISAYEKLKVMPLYANRTLGLNLSLSQTEPIQSQLVMQCTKQETITMRIEPISGHFSIGPVSQAAAQIEWTLNNKTVDPANHAHEWLTQLRCSFVAQDILLRGLTMGWEKPANLGLKFEEIKPIVPKGTLQMTWLKRKEWSQDWYVGVSIGMSGEQWWLFQMSRDKRSAAGDLLPGVKIENHLRIPVNSVSPWPSHTFLSSLHTFAAALLSTNSNIRALHTRRTRYVLHQASLRPGPSPMKLPVLFIRLSDLVPSKDGARTVKAWAKDCIKLTFQGLERLPQRKSQSTDQPSDQPSTDVSTESQALMVTEARLTLSLPPNVALQERIDRDIAFHPTTGTFAFKIHTRVGSPVLNALTERLQRIERLVEFVGVMKKHEKSLLCETVSLGKVIFSYRTPPPENAGKTADTKLFRAEVDFGAENGVVKLSLEKGNPHIRVLDGLTSILRSVEGLDVVATLLPLTLPVFKKCDDIEAAWRSRSALGQVYFFVRSLDWIVVRYTLVSTTGNDEKDKSGKGTTMNLDIRLRQREGEAWWHIKPLFALPAAFRDEDSPAQRLHGMFSSQGDFWRGMGTSATAQAAGVEELLSAVDAAVSGIGSNAAPGSDSTAPIKEEKDSRQVITLD
jgi:mediator of RNA polymerase II transcription subunit 14